VVVNGVKSTWQRVMSSVPKGPVLGLALFSVFLGDLNEGNECTLSKFAHDSKLSGVADMLGIDAIQRDLNKLKRWAYVNLMRFSVAKR